MKKLIFAAAVAIFSSLNAQEKQQNPFVYQETKNIEADDESSKMPTAPGDPAPINDYLPLLAAAGVGIAFLYGRKKKIA